MLLSNRPDFPVDGTKHRHDVCVENAKSADGMVLWIDRRFGAPYHADGNISVTWAEFRAAHAAGVPVIAFVRKSIFTERLVHKKNHDVKLMPAFVDDVRTFAFLDEIQSDTGVWLQPVEDSGEAVSMLRKWRFERADDFRVAPAKAAPERVGDLSADAKAVLLAAAKDATDDMPLTSALIADAVAKVYPSDAPAVVDWEQVAREDPGAPRLWYFRPQRPVGSGNQWVAIPTPTAYGTGVRAELDEALKHVELHLAGSLGR